VHERHGAEGMSESRMLGSGKYKVPDAKLADSTQSLHLGRLDQIEQEASGHGNEPVNWVGKDLETTGHVLAALRK